MLGLILTVSRLLPGFIITRYHRLDIMEETVYVIRWQLKPEDKDRLQRYAEALASGQAHQIGYPPATDFDYSALYPFFGTMLNNIGDVAVPSPYTAHSKDFEQEVISFFAELFRAPKDGFWGYVTNGGTESNLSALYRARTLYPDGIVFYSDAAHYSVTKNAHLLGMSTVTLHSQKHGEMDYDDLARQLSKHAGTPAIVVATIGTTMTEARDNVQAICSALKHAGVTEHYIHVDGALAGAYASFSQPHWPFDFADGADSIALSGHKFIGSPVPCGIILATKQPSGQQEFVPYIDTFDTTISGSRSGHAPLFLWYAIKRWGRTGLEKRARAGFTLAAYAEKRLTALGWHAWRNPDTLTVVLKAPPRHIAAKWQLATEGGWSHIICMPGVTRERIDRFLADMASVVV